MGYNGVLRITTNQLLRDQTRLAGVHHGSPIATFDYQRVPW